MLEKNLEELAEARIGRRNFQIGSVYILALAAGPTDASRTIHEDQQLDNHNH
jgi:hypothetical protein